MNINKECKSVTSENALKILEFVRQKENKKLFHFLIDEINKKEDDMSMLKGRVVKYLNDILEVCNNESLMDYKKSLFLFEDLDELINYNKTNEKIESKKLLNEYFERLVGICRYDGEILNPLSCEEHGFINLFFIESLKKS